MEFDHLLQLVGDEPLFETSLLLAGKVSPGYIRQQLTRWINSGRIIQLRRGLYAIAPPYRKVKPHPFVIANRLQRASYVSTQSALTFYGLIPETIYATTSISTGRPERLETPLGVFAYRHVKQKLLAGYTMVDFDGQQALLALPEKALLDTLYLQPDGESLAYLQSLRLQNLEQLNPDMLESLALVFDTPKIYRAVEAIRRIIQQESNDYQDLN
jgi:hypothetical protein